MPNLQTDAFLNIGKKAIRNIVNAREIKQYLHQISIDKNLDNYPLVNQWLNTVVKNYLIKKADYTEFQSSVDLSVEIRDLVANKNIPAPYHIVDLDTNLTNKITHCIDYLQSSMPKDKDLSRISFEQAQINADVWLENRLKNLSEEEDVENVIPYLSLEENGEIYTWVNIRSRKGLERESKIMNHCIESYWDKKYPDFNKVESQSPYFSLRNKDNKPLVTLEQDIDEKGVMHIQEIKEFANQQLSNKYRLAVEKFIDFSKSTLTYPAHYHFYPEKNNFNRLKSINYFINNNIFLGEKSSLKYGRGLNIQDFINDFPVNNLLKTVYFKKIDIELTNIERNISIIADNVSLKEGKNKNIKIDSNNIKIKNLSNVDVEIQGIDYIKDTKEDHKYGTIIIENIYDSKIKINSKFYSKPLIIFKNCSNVELDVNNYYEMVKPHPNINYQRHKENNISTKLFNILMVNSDNINIPNKFKRNIIDVKDDNIKLNLYQNPGDKTIKYENFEKAVYCSLGSFAVTEIINRYIKNEGMDCSDLLLKNFIKDMKINVQYKEEKNPEVEVNCYKLPIDLEKDNIINLLSNPLSSLSDYLYSKIADKEKLFISPFFYENYIKNNSLNILMDKKLDCFPGSSTIIYNLQEGYIEKLKIAKNKLIKVKEDDNFSDYFRSVFDLYLQENPLLIYMVKNDVLEYMLQQDNHKVAYRFSYSEKRMKAFNAKRWAEVIGDSEDQQYIFEIMMKPYDNNVLLLKNYILKDVVEHKISQMRLSQKIENLIPSNNKPEK